MTASEPPSWVDRLVDATVPIAVRDYGGVGPDVLLLPGAGRTVADWTPVASRLAGYRLVALDLRNHGLSGDGEWTMANALVDVQTVIDGLGLSRPALVGHSLGGILAGLWAARHPECPAVVNLDGHGQGRPEQYDGMDPDVVRQRMSELRGLALAAAPPSLSAEEADSLIAAQVGQAQQSGLDVAAVEEGLRRSVRISGGSATLRPSPPSVQQLMDFIDELDLMSVWSSARCRLLLVNAVAPPDLTLVGGPDWLGGFMAAYRRGLTRAIGAVVAANPLVTLDVVDADHSLLLNRPDATATLIRDFLDAASR